MTDFHSSRTIKATRRNHSCDQCGKTIFQGCPAEYGSGKYDGNIYSVYTHVECHAAAVEYAKINGLYGEDWPWFQHMEDSEHEHHAWLLEKHPIVADRLNINREAVAA
jgi:hypothetical protein